MLNEICSSVLVVGLVMMDVSLYSVFYEGLD